MIIIKGKTYDFQVKSIEDLSTEYAVWFGWNTEPTVFIPLIINENHCDELKVVLKELNSS